MNKPEPAPCPAEPAEPEIRLALDAIKPLCNKAGVYWAYLALAAKVTAPEPAPLREALHDALERLYSEQAAELNAGGMRQRNAAFVIAREFAALAAAPEGQPSAIVECYGDCRTGDPATCPNPCKFQGRPGQPSDRSARAPIAKVNVPVVIPAPPLLRDFAGSTEDALRMALRMLYDETADYIKLNNLGGMDNHAMRLAREALGQQVALQVQGALTDEQIDKLAKPFNDSPYHKGDGQVIAFSRKDWREFARAVRALAAGASAPPAEEK